GPPHAEPDGRDYPRVATVATHTLIRSHQMTKTYYAVCNVNGPISVRLPGETREQALAAFAALDTRAAIDECSMDIENDLGIDGEDMTEYEFACALEEAGAEY